MTTRCHVIGHGLGTRLYCCRVQKPSLALVALVSVALLSGCSSEPSPQEKRNLFDKCVLDYIEENRTFSPYQNQIIEDQAPFKCKDLLG
jgi:hypothetical protein